MFAQRCIGKIIILFIVFSVVFPLFIISPTTAAEETQVWTHFYTINKVVNDIYIDGDILWAATDGGFTVWNLTSGEYYGLTTSDGLAGDIVKAVTKSSDGAMWFATYGGGVGRYDGHTWSTFDTTDGLAHKNVMKVVQSRDGALWFATITGGVSKYHNGFWTTYTKEDGLADNNVISVMQADDDSMWFATSNGGASRLDGQTWSSLSTEDGLSYHAVRAINQSSNGDFWFGTSGGGVSLYDGVIWTTFNMGDGLAYNAIMDIMQASDGAMWFATYGGGVSRFDGTTWTSFTTADGLADNFVTAVEQSDDGAMWFATWGGISRLELGEKSMFPQDEIWQPAPDTSWQWQLTGEIDTSIDVQMYDIDLFDAPQSVIDQLHDDGRIVICYFSAGSWEDWRPDADQFPASIIGSNLDEWEGEWWLDIRQIDVLDQIMTARLDMAVEKGCEGVEPDNVDGYINDAGFPLTYEDQIAYNTWLADQAHSRGLSIGLKNDMDQIPDLLSHFDWALNEQCYHYDECETLLPFIQTGKAVFGVEYEGEPEEFCPIVNGIEFDWLKKNMDLDEWLISCKDFEGGLSEKTWKTTISIPESSTALSTNTLLRALDYWDPSSSETTSTTITTTDLLDGVLVLWDPLFND